MSTERAVLRAKIALEQSLIRPLGLACYQYLADWDAAGGSLGYWVKIRHQQSIQQVLEAHYARVLMSMAGRVGANDTLDHAATSLRHAEKLRARAHQQSIRILNSLDRELDKALTLVKSEMTSIETKDASKKPSWSVQFVGQLKETVSRAWEKVKSKLPSISNLETQEVAEGAQVEWVEQEHANSTVTKVWHNMGDERVRGNPAGIYRSGKFDHWSAEGQEVSVREPFTVSGEHLMHPGDGSMGASLGNLVNCRCGTTYYVIGADGSRVKIPLRMPSLPAKRTWHEGDRLGKETPISPTTLVTLNGKTRARIVLGDGKTFATLRQERPDLITVTVNGKPVARATTSGPDVTSITIAPEVSNQNIEALIRDSVRHSHEFHQSRARR